MAEGNLFNCPTCGSSLTPQPNETQVKCAYCGNKVVIPEHLRETKVQVSPETTRWIKIGIWGFIILMIITIVVPLVCSICGVFGGLAGALAPLFVK